MVHQRISRDIDDGLGFVRRSAQDGERATAANSGSRHRLRHHSVSDEDGLDAAEAQPAARAPVGFNYLGQFDAVATDESAFVLSTESVGKEHDPDNPMEYELDINASVVNGRLEVMWTYSRERYRSGTITSLATAYLKDLRTLIAHCLSADAGGYTPSDFPNVELEQDALDAILEQMN